MASNHDWDAAQYGKFIDERTRPAVELLRRVALDTPSVIYDLGCGPGNSTALLKNRWPEATVVGVDSSEAMLATARKDRPDIEFVLHDIATWSCEVKADLIFSNAAYQWVPEHDKLIPKLLEFIRPGGIFAMQMPHNHDRFTHKSMRTVAGAHNWSVDLSHVRQIKPVMDAHEYYDLLCSSMYQIDIWETEYFHVMDTMEAITEWLKSTGLKPFIDPLDSAERLEFIRRFECEFLTHISQLADGKVFLPFPRLFAVARRK